MQLNNFQPVPQPVVSPAETTPTDDTGHPRRSAYAAMSDLREQFSTAGICAEQVWEFIKTEYSVDSRSKLTGKQWATIAAQLQSARREPQLFKVYVDAIPCEYFRIHVFSDDPNVPIGRPRDLRKHHLAAEWGDFQALATDNQCTITVTQRKKTVFYEPAQKPSPVNRLQKPVARKPVIALDTNARGEILNMFGDVVEVSA